MKVRLQDAFVKGGVRENSTTPGGGPILDSEKAWLREKKSYGKKIVTEEIFSPREVRDG